MTIEIKISDTTKTDNLLYGDDNLGITSKHFLKKQRPWFPIMGEFHYSRFDHHLWSQELAKIKSSGIDIISSYTIWIHHEEEKGYFNFSGDNNLHRFIEECQNNNLYFFLRLGPWSHAEVKNGGLPDWLLAETSNTRQNDPTYLHYVKEFFKQIYKQCAGLFYKDGGPIIGIQVENEYGHSGGYTDSRGYDHLTTIMELISDIGFNVPFYTGTAWGGAIWLENSMLPVFGGYADAPWAQTSKSIPLNANFLITDKRDDPNIASEYTSNNTIDETIFKSFPYLTAELGTGLEPTYRRRPIITKFDTESMILSKLASGANMLGYYMFHGGTNPIGKTTTMQESKESGSLNSLATLNYDFQAPLNEFGYFNESYKALRKLHVFIHEFESTLALSEVTFPEKIIIDPTNKTDLRYSVRFDKKSNSGFIFINNYQRGIQMNAHKHIKFHISASNLSITTPEIDVPSNSTKIIPFNIKLKAARLVSTNANILCQIGEMPILFDKHPEKITANFAGANIPFISLSDNDANNALRIKNHLLICTEQLWSTPSNNVYVESTQDTTIRLLPENKNLNIHFKKATCTVTPTKERNLKDYQEIKLSFNYFKSEDTADISCNVNYLGDRLEFYKNEELIADALNTNGNYRLSLAKFGYPDHLTLRIYNWNSNVYFDKTFDQSKLGLTSIKCTPLYKKMLTFE